MKITKPRDPFEFWKKGIIFSRNMKHTQEKFQVPGKDHSFILAVAYGTLHKMGAQPKFVLNHSIIANLEPGEDDTEIVVEAREETVLINRTHEENGFKLFKSKSTDTFQFIEEFKVILQGHLPKQISEWHAEIEKLRQETESQLQDEHKLREEVSAIMNSSSDKMYVTYGLIIINVLVFILMAVLGVHPMNPETQDLIDWGANYMPLTLGGEGWRLLSCCFLHIGVIHLAFNMYALFAIGKDLEPMLGSFRYIAAYITAGLLGAVTSIWWNGSEVVSAGASGAIFGLYGVFLSMLTTSLIPAQVRKPLLLGIAIFVLYNLIYGLKGNVDNAAHIGGLLSGMLAGYIYYLDFKRPSPVRIALSATAILIIGLATSTLFTGIGSARGIASYASGGLNEYQQSMMEIYKLEEEAMGPLTRIAYSRPHETAEDLQYVSLPAWKEGSDLLRKTHKEVIPEILSKHRNLLQEYFDLRIEQTNLLIRISKGDSTLMPGARIMESKIDSKVKELDNLLK